MQTSSIQGSHLLTTRDFEFGETIFEEKRTCNLTPSSQFNYLPKKMKVPHKIRSALVDLRKQALKTYPMVISDFDIICRFLLMRTKIDIDKVFESFGQLADKMLLSYQQKKLVNFILETFPDTILKDTDVDDLELLLKNTKCMEILIGKNFNGLFSLITYLRHHCEPNVICFEEENYVRAVCIHKDGIDEGSALLATMVRPFRSRDYRHSEL
eukprot:UN28962